MTTTEQVLALLDQYNWIRDKNQHGDLQPSWTKMVTTGPTDPVEQNRPWKLQFSVTTGGLRVYISADAINSIQLNETVGPVDPLYHDFDSLTARLEQLQ